MKQTFSCLWRIRRLSILLCGLLSLISTVLPLRAWSAPAENDPVWRVQLEVVVADVSDAGTDDTVMVQVNGGDPFVLDYGRNDFERNSRFRYDVMNSGVRTFADITALRISKKGTDGLCLRRITLFVNGVPVFDRDFGAGGYWIDNDDGHPRAVSFNASTLRNSPEWRAYRLPFPPLVLPAEEIASRIEAMVGHAISGETPYGNLKSLYWGHRHGNYVEIQRKNARAISVDLDLGKKVNNAPNPEVDVDFDLGFSCNAGRIRIAVNNVDADVDWAWYHGLWSVGILPILEAGINRGLDGLSSALQVAWEIDTHQPLCPDFLVQPDGGLLIVPPAGVARARAVQ